MKWPKILQGKDHPFQAKGVSLHRRTEKKTHFNERNCHSVCAYVYRFFSSLSTFDIVSFGAVSPFFYPPPPPSDLIQLAQHYKEKEVKDQPLQENKTFLHQPTCLEGEGGILKDHVCCPHRFTMIG